MNCRLLPPRARWQPIGAAAPRADRPRAALGHHACSRAVEARKRVSHPGATCPTMETSCGSRLVPPLRVGHRAPPLRPMRIVPMLHRRPTRAGRWWRTTMRVSQPGAACHRHEDDRVRRWLLPPQRAGHRSRPLARCGSSPCHPRPRCVQASSGGATSRGAGCWTGLGQAARPLERGWYCCPGSPAYVMLDVPLIGSRP